jgi:hypothetical protein
MQVLVRLGLAAIAAIAGFYFVFWLPCSLLFRGDPTGLLSFLVSAICAGFFARYVFLRTGNLSESLASSVLLGALLVGGVSFCAGFFGPILFAPGANQGPMLGIFITGPLGFVAGAIGGAVYWHVRRRRTAVR